MKSDTKKNKQDAINIEKYLSRISEKRRGGEYNLYGIGYQIQYACYRILSELADNDSAKNHIRLEGLEDVDVQNSIEIDQSEYIQLKYSKATIDASKLLQSNAIRNFLEVHVINPDANFTVVHNAAIRQKEILDLSRETIPQQTIDFWKKKIEEIAYDQSIDVVKFLSRIKFTQMLPETINSEIDRLLFQKMHVNKGTEHQYFQSLFYHVYQWSKERAIVTNDDIAKVFTLVSDSFSKAPINEAIRNDWITPIKYDASAASLQENYFSGQAAKPVHIVQKLPVRRLKWEKLVLDAINSIDIVVINSSSGQGKSTLAWQIGLNLVQTGMSVYQLNYCKDWNDASTLYDFIYTRLKIGECPVIVIDGLNSDLKAWHLFAERSVLLPVKFLITSREEDWYRFGADVSKLSLKILSPRLTISEAKDIYGQLSKKGLLHNNVTRWEQAWESVAKEGLLMEYTYLLTKGEMLHVRLEHQIKKLNNEPDSYAKIEILRLISMADCLNVKLETSSLINYIKAAVGFITDYDVALKQLENEYFVSFQKIYVEGLHPVRSQHLVTILHNTTHCKESILKIFELIRGDFIYDFSMSFHPYIEPMKKLEFFSELAQLTKQKNLLEIVNIIDGLMHIESRWYWETNREIFDAAYQLGCIDLFSYQSCPFIDFSFEELAESIGSDFNQNLLALNNFKRQLAIFEFRNSDIYLFVKKFGEGIDKSWRPESLEGLEFLTRWCQKLNISLPLNLGISEQVLMESLNSMSHVEVKEIYAFYRSLNENRYKLFVNVNKDIIIGWLKVQTDTLTIYEEGNDIHIEYLLYDNVQKSNDLSVNRIRFIYHFLPYYNKYVTNAIVFPFPDNRIYDVVLMDAHKEMSSEVLHHGFDVHLRQIWSNTIKTYYQHLTVYEWQEEQIEIRNVALDFCKNCIRIFEGLLERNDSKWKTAMIETEKHMISFSNQRRLVKYFPQAKLRYFTENLHKDQLKDISSWYQYLSNFINHLPNLINPNKMNQGTDYSRIAVVNLKNIVFELKGMQKGFDSIQQNSFPYFEINKLIDYEQKSYKRLLTTVSYFVANFRVVGMDRLIVTKNEVNLWWSKLQQFKLEEIISILHKCESETNFIFHAPNEIVDTQLWDEVIIGTENLDISNQEEMFNLLSGLKDIGATSIQYVTVVLIKKDVARSAFRVKKEMFLYITDLLNNEVPQFEVPLVFPMVLTDDVVGYLPGIRLETSNSQIDDAVVVNAMVDLWKLMESRNRLKSNFINEANWKKELEAEYQYKIQAHLKQIENKKQKGWDSSLRNFITDYLDGQHNINIDDITSKLNDYVTGIVTAA